MISADNVPLNSLPSDADFTISGYRDLLRLAKRSYLFSSYSEIPWGQRFVLWRHDCDYSLNRAHAIAQVEKEEGVHATYFLNPHSEFYNLFEKSQHHLVQQIIEMGHYIGLHFDAGFHDISDEKKLGQQVSSEAAILEELYGVKPLVFSFHNPVSSHMNCEAETYGGLVNCYSSRFKSEVPYCSDSNGFWRYRRLCDVLTEATDPCIQVLTHPGWWQESVMPPRQRIFRSIYDRAGSTLRAYDAELEKHDRPNHAGAPVAIQFLKALDQRLFDLFDLLWNKGYLETLYVELWRLHEQQIINMCKAELRKHWKVPAAEINTFFEDPAVLTDGRQLFSSVFGETWQSLTSMERLDYGAGLDLRNAMIRGHASPQQQLLEEGSIFLCRSIESLATWGRLQSIHYDGINHLGTTGIQTAESVDGRFTGHLEENSDEVSVFSESKWEKFKADMQKAGADEAVS